MRRGQTMVEYLLILILLMGAAIGTGYVVKAIHAQTARTSVLIGSDFP